MKLTGLIEIAESEKDDPFEAEIENEIDSF